jgi:hypothetical protein
MAKHNDRQPHFSVFLGLLCILKRRCFCVSGTGFMFILYKNIISQRRDFYEGYH